MTKQEFLKEIKKNIHALPRKDRKRVVEYFSEMIDDRMEDGLSEEEAIAEIGEPQEAARQTISDPAFLAEIKPEAARPKNNALLIVLAILGSPLWIAFAAVVLALLLVFYILLFVFVVVLFVLVLALGLSAIAMLVAGIYELTKLMIPLGFFLIGAFLALTGLTLLAFLGARQAAVGLVRFAGITFKGLTGLAGRRRTS